MKDILPPKSDIVFKLLFGDQHNIDLLSDFLKSVLNIKDDEDLSEITIVDPHLLRKHPDKKLGIIDLKAKTKSGEIIHIEIQLTDRPEISKRIVFYEAGLITEQLGVGEDYNLLKRVISILIFDYDFIGDNRHYHHRFTFYDHEWEIGLTDLIEIHTLELPKLPEKADNNLWNWLRFLRVTSREDLDMVVQTNPTIKKAVGKLLELSQDERARMLYEAREKQRVDNLVSERAAFEKGMEKGMGKGLEKGLVKGMSKKAIEVAQELLNQNISIEIIEKATGLPRKEIEQLHAKA